MIDFSTLQGVAIPEGVVTQIESGGVVIWKLAEAGSPIVLEVTKKTGDTYAGGTEYTDEKFIVLDIYPKTSSATVNVTYGGLTKTIQFSGTNAQRVYFGTFNGVSDSVETPDSGTLTIEGGCVGVGGSVYQNGSKSTNKGYFLGITGVSDWGGVTTIPANAFSDGTLNGSSAAISYLPEKLKSIGSGAFACCENVTVSELPEGLASVGKDAFYDCEKQTSVNLPASVSSIGVNPWRRSNFKGGNFISVNSGNPYFKIDGNCLIEINTGNVVAGYNDGVIPSCAKAIGENAFNGNTSMTSVSIPEGVTTIGATAFFNCISLVSITVPSTVTSIGAQALDPNRNAYANLLTVRVNATTPPSLGSSVFDAESLQSIIVPTGCGEAYKAAEGWSTFADYIVEG